MFCLLLFKCVQMRFFSQKLNCALFRRFSALARFRTQSFNACAEAFAPTVSVRPPWHL